MIQQKLPLFTLMDKIFFAMQNTDSMVAFEVSEKAREGNKTALCLVAVYKKWLKSCDLFLIEQLPERKTKL